MSKKYYESNRDKIIERNKASYKKYYAERKQEILAKKRIQYKEKGKTKSSHMDSLPENILNQIYYDKHCLEHTDTLNMIKKLRYKGYDENNVCFLIPNDIKYLFKHLTTNKTIIINLNGYGDSSCDLLYFNPSENDIKKAQQKLNCVIKILSDNECVVSAVQIRFNNPRLKNPLTVIEVLEILQ